MSPPATLLLLTLTGMLAYTQGQVTGYHLGFSRISHDGELNRILLECVFSFNGSLALGASFFRNDVLYDIPGSVVVNGVGVRFVVDRLSEGNFTCGVGGSTSSPSQTIVARPDSSEIPEMETFYADIGSTAHLDCSITPGKQIPFYYVTWRNASNQDMIFYRIFPLLSTGQEPPFVLSDRYSIDSQTFSLYIRDARFDDAADDYQCVLGVVEPSNNQPNLQHEFTRTEDVNISLSIFKAPRFTKEPRPQVVRNGTNVTFTCNVISSPRDSPITWKRGGTIVDERDTRLEIRTDVEEVAKGRMINSFLTISNVTGFDNYMVECLSEYSGDTGSMVFRVRSAATLGVLDEVQLQPPIQFQSGGFIFPIIPKRPLLIPVMVQLLYTNADNAELRSLVQSVTTYFNSTLMNVIAFREEVPYDSFNLGVALFYEDVEGPVIQSNDVYSRNDSRQSASQSDCTGFIGAFSAVFIILIIVIFFIFTIFVINKRHKFCSGKKNVELKDGVERMVCNINTANNYKISLCYCHSDKIAHDGTDEIDGFTIELAESLVTNLDKVVEFCKRNPVIMEVLERRKILDSSPSLSIGNGRSSTESAMMELTIETKELK